MLGTVQTGVNRNGDARLWTKPRLCLQNWVLHHHSGNYDDGIRFTRRSDVDRMVGVRKL